MPPDQTVNPLFASPLIPFVFIAIIFYFLVMKPEKTKQNQRKEMLKNLKKNTCVALLPHTIKYK